MQILFLVFMFILGAAFGSFLCCQARRLKMREQKTKKMSSRSISLHCKKQLKWYDNIPIISWCILRGKCRYCHKKIGIIEIISELATAIAFVMIGTTINVEHATWLDWLTFAAVILFSLSLAFLAVYDGMCGELPTFALIIAAILAIAAIIPNLCIKFTPMPFASAALFGGIYLVLYLVSKGKWVGDGDWVLSAVIGLVLGHPWLALIALFVSNVSACLVMYPIVKDRKSHQIYFGPFLVLAFVVTYTFSDFFISMI